MDLSINLSPYPAPKTYMRYGTQAYIDPFRQILVPETPDSILLYKMEMYVHKTMGVPKNRMLIQQSLRRFGINSTKVISIVILDVIEGHLVPIALVDCASPSNPLSFVPLAHLEEFAKARNINYLIVTNGTEVDSYISRADRLSFWKIDNVPDYKTIQEGHQQMLLTSPPTKLPNDKGHDKSKDQSKAKSPAKNADKKKKPTAEVPMPVAPSRPVPIHPVVAHLSDLLVNSKQKLPLQKHCGITLALDCGKRKKVSKATLTPTETALQRTFLIEDLHKNYQLMAVDIEEGTHSTGGTSIAVTLDHFEHRQTIFNLDFASSIRMTEVASTDAPRYECHLDLNLAFESSGSDFVTGLIGEIGRHMKEAKLEASQQLQMIGPNRLYLGTLSTETPESGTQFFMAMMALALIVDEFRETLKRRRQR